MVTHAVEGTKVLSDNSIRAARQPSDLSESLKRQLALLLDATMRETWLPMGFRVLVAQNFPTMRRSLDEERKARDLGALSACVTSLLEEAEPYKVFAKRSAALLALRTVQAELSAARSAA